MTSTSLSSPPRSPSPTDERKRLLSVVTRDNFSKERTRLPQSFETALEAAGLSPATVRLYRHGVRSLYTHLDRMGLNAPLSSVSAEHLRHWMTAERRGGASPATREALHKAMRRFFAFLTEEGEVGDRACALSGRKPQSTRANRPCA